MSEKEVEKANIIRLDEHQFRHLLTAFGSISRELGSIANKLERLETAVTKIEGELKLIRIEINALKEKPKKQVSHSN
jgi:archaellum component FlaC